MQVSRTIWNAMTSLIAADTATLANASAMKVRLVAAAFSPALDLDISTLTYATFTGSTAKAAGTGAQQVFVDPTVGGRTVQILEPAGGWTWLCTVDPGSPETIYGFVLTDNAGTGLLGSALLPAPITISASGQGITLPNIRFLMPASAPQNAG